MNNNRTLRAATLGAALATAIAAQAATPATRIATTHAMPAKSTPQTNYTRFIVKYRGGTTQSRSAVSLLGALNTAATRSIPDASLRPALSVVRRTSLGADVVRGSRALNQTQADAFLAQLRSDPNVEFAQPDYRVTRLDTIPNDAYFSQLQWDFTHPTAGIRAPAAWDVTAGAGVVVAVIDTGYVDHADLAANIVPGYDFISDPEIANDGDGRDADAHDPGDWEGDYPSSFHGTHVAGTIAAVTNNAIGVAGIAYRAKVQPVRVLGKGGGWTSDIADAIVWASGGHVDGVPDNTNPAEVLNLSLGGRRACSTDPVTQAAIDGAISRGVTVVVAAGNDTMDASYASPASCKGVLTVGATGIDGAKAWFSNYGAPVAISAPGGNADRADAPNDRWIWSLGNSGSQAPVPSPAGDRVIGMIGTSMASPHVAGIVALMQAAAVGAGNPALTPEQVRRVLRQTALKFTVVPPVNTPMGAGIANAAAAVLAAKQPIANESATRLVNRQVVSASGAAGKGLLYAIDVPAGTRALNVRTYGGTGNVSLYVAYGYQATAGLYDKVSNKPGNTETVAYTNPLAGTYYVRVVGETAFSNVSVTATY